MRFVTKWPITLLVQIQASHSHNYVSDATFLLANTLQRVMCNCSVVVAYMCYQVAVR